MHYLKQEHLLERIIISSGQPTIRSSLLAVQDILKAIADNQTFVKLKEKYPFLEEDDIKASILYNDIQLFNSLRIEPYFCEYNQIAVISKPEDMYKDETGNWIIIGGPGVDGIEFRIKNNFESDKPVYVYYPIDNQYVEIADSPQELICKWKDDSIHF